MDEWLLGPDGKWVRLTAQESARLDARVDCEDHLAVAMTSLEAVMQSSRTLVAKSRRRRRARTMRLRIVPRLSPRFE